ncbi:hypothetical protein [Chondromyces crocatus]|uniref:PEGA domain-containing protein n=1 Tax=Chondromyces crocatus TaxID=52 RepID=A0A0K1E7D7_CHOCO|nr:hypothetical protein [Chondromyces crocatus]AKT36774.1 uncharacterized protein CMC5_008950 [Chondromyces crocatus]
MMKRAQRTGLVASLVLASSLAATAPAFADEPGPDTVPINIVAIQTGEAYDQAEALTKALRAALKTVPGWSLAEGDYSLEVLTLSLKCTDIPDAGCQSRIADQIKADRYIWGNVTQKGTSVVGQLHLWVRGQGTTSTPIEYSANLTEANDESLRRVAADSIQALTGGPPKGSIHIKAGNITGQVFINGQPAGALVNGEGTFPIPAGNHRVLVKSTGHFDSEAAVVVKAAGTADVTLTPVPTASSEPLNWRKIGGFAGIGAGVAFGAVGLVSVFQVNSTIADEKVDAYRSTVTGNMCETARQGNSPDAQHVASACDKARTFELMQAIFFPLAAVSAGAGVYLLATSGDSPAASTTGWTFQPSVGLESGRLSATYRW